MDYLKQILLESEGEEKGPTGGEWEYLLIAASDAKYVKFKSNQASQINDPAIKKTCEKWWTKGYKQKAESIIEKIKIKNLKKIDNGNVSNEWKKYFFNISKIVASQGVGTVGSPNGTSKTDLKSTQKYSLKKAGGSQLMSGFRAEALATLFAAFDLSTITKNINYSKIFKNQIETIAIGMGGSPDDYGDFESATDITEKLKEIHDEYLNSQGYYPDKKDAKKKWRPSGIKYDDPKVIAQIKKQAGWKELEKKVKGYIENSWARRKWHEATENAFAEIFKTPEIWKNFLLEASSGEKKFGKETDQCAEYILEFDPENPEKTYKKEIEAFVNAYAERVKINISFKTASNRINDSCRLIIGPPPKKNILQNTIQTNKLDSVLVNIVNNIIYNENNEKRIYINYEEIYIPKEMYDNFLNEIILLFKGFEEIEQTESTMIIQNPLTATLNDITSGINSTADNISSGISNITKKIKQTITSKTETKNVTIGNSFINIIQNFVIEEISPIIINQYSDNISKILKSKTVSNKFFRILKFFNISKIEINGKENLFSKVGSDEFSFMFREKE